MSRLRRPLSADFTFSTFHRRKTIFRNLLVWTLGPDQMQFVPYYVHKQFNKQTEQKTEPPLSKIANHNKSFHVTNKIDIDVVVTDLMTHNNVQIGAGWM